MDKQIAHRLTKDNDSEFKKKILTLVKTHIDSGEKSLNFFIDEFDAAHDIFMCYAPIKKSDLKKFDSGAPKDFILPMTATQITTMTTFVSQVLFGGVSPWKVDARNDSDEERADMMNQLLRWNASLQPTYLIGYLWVESIMLYNRGVMYDYWKRLETITVEPEEAEDPTAEAIEEPQLDEAGQPMTEDIPDIDELTGVHLMDQMGNLQFKQQPVMASRQPTYTKWRKKRDYFGGYNKIELVSSYNFICDPLMPIHRYQEGRFAGHKTNIPWIELKKRSKLPVDDPMYVMPDAVEALKNKQNPGVGASPSGQSATNTAGTSATTVSRTRHERTRNVVPEGQTKTDDKDGGVIEVHELWVKLIPSDYNFMEEDEDGADEVETYQIVVANRKEILSVNLAISQHDMYPYSVAEGRPSAHYQFAPSWALMLKPIQDHCDYLKNVHQRALTKNGNMFIINPMKVDVKDFQDPDKIGLMIELTPDAQGEPIDNVIKQIQMVDYTKDFHQEMQQFIDFAEVTTGATEQMQGVAEEGVTATASSSAAQMGAGRLTSIARMISVTGLVPQTTRFVKNFQQFLTDQVVVRLRGDDVEFRPQFKGKKSVTIDRDSVLAEFDVEPHDGSLPGTDQKAVAAGTRALEVAAQFPQFFDKKIPGNYDLQAIMGQLFKKSGIPVENYIVTPEQAAEAMQAEAIAAGAQIVAPPQGMPPAPGQVPQSAMSGDRIDTGAGLTLPDVNSIPGQVAPPQARPQNV